FKKGINSMDSKKALAFSRERKSFSLGDLQRGLNQQEVIKALIKRIMEIRDFKTLNRLVEQVGKYVDTNINSDDIGKLLDLQISNNPSWDITTHMLEGERGSAPSYAFGGQYHNMVFPDSESVKEITQKIHDLLNKR
ncbi:MAG: LCP family protein, partial [Erysipelotrichaceae bacterium]